MKTFIIADIHGRYSALIEIFKKAGFNKKIDRLIIIGDVVDGGPSSASVVEELLEIEHRTFIYGNHDILFKEFIKSGHIDPAWISVGGRATLRSYGYEILPPTNSIDEIELMADGEIPDTHKEFFNSGAFYHLEDNILYVHGGLRPYIPLSSQTEHDLTWDRLMFSRWAPISKISFMKGRELYTPKHIFCGHTTTQLINNGTLPLTYNNVTNIDTGGGFDGKLTMMDITGFIKGNIKSVSSCRKYQSKKQVPGITV